MVKAIYNGHVLARSEDTVVVDRKHYFKPEDVNWDFLEESDHHTVCPWKGTADYYHLKVDGKRTENAVWVYKQPKEEAKHIKGRIAFSYIHGVDTEEG